MRTNAKGNIITLIIVILSVIEVLLVFCSVKMSENGKEILRLIEKQKQLVSSIAIESLIYADLTEIEDGTTIKNKIDGLLKEFEKNSRTLLLEKNPIRIPGEFILVENMGIDEIKIANDIKKEWETYKATVNNTLLTKDKTGVKHLYGENNPYINNIIEKMTFSVNTNISNNEKKLNMALAIVAGIIIVLMLFMIIINARFFSALKKLKKELKSDVDTDRVSYISGKFCREVEEIKLSINNRNNKIETVVEGIRKNSEEAEINNLKLLKMFDELKKINSVLGEEALKDTEVGKTILEESKKTDENINAIKNILSETLEISNSGLNNIVEMLEETKKIQTASENGAELIKGLDRKKTDIENIVQTILDAAININIIALNSGIEATRAGESGKGFEKISEELTKMSGIMKNISKDIKNNVFDISEKTDLVIITMNNINKIIEKNTVNTEKSKNDIEQVQSKIEDMKGKTDISADIIKGNNIKIADLYEGVIKQGETIQKSKDVFDIEISDSKKETVKEEVKDTDKEALDMLLS